MEEYRRYKQNYNIKVNNSKNSSGRIEYKRVEKRTISINTGTNNSLYNQYNTLANKNYLNNKDNKSLKSNSFTTHNSTTSNSNLNKSYTSKQQFSYADKVREKNNYTYYVSGVGYINKNEENKTEKKVIKANLPPRPKPNPINRTNQIKIQIQHKRVIDQSKKELVDNYQYHETKSLKKDNSKGTVSHKRLCEPVYSYTNKTTKKFSSYTEQPRTVNKSFERKEYEIVEPKRPTKQKTNTNITNISNITNINNRTQRLSRPIENKYTTNRPGSYNNRNYQNVYDNKRKNSSYVRKEENTRTKNNYVYSSRDISGDRNKNNIRNSNINNNNNLQKDTKVIVRNTETRSNRNYNQNFNNVQRHEIKAVSNDKKIVNNYSHNKTNTNIIERKQYFPRVTRETNITQKYNNTNANINTNTNRRNVYDSRTQEINQRIKTTVYNSSNKPRHTAQVIDYRRNINNNRNNTNNYSLAPVKQIEHNYEYNRSHNIPQHLEQFAIYEVQRMNEYNQNYPSNMQIHFNQRSQNIPQTVQEIQVHEKKEIMPQHVQQIEVYEGNNNKQESIEQNIEKNEEDYQNIEEENMENIENIEQNYEQQEEVKEEQVNIDNIDNTDNIENNEMEENEEKNMDNMEENKNIEENNINEIEQNNENIENNENMEQMEEKIGNIQIQNNIQMEEKDENEEEKNKFQMQKIEYDQYISQDNINTSEERYQLNERQYMNNEEFNNENNYINFCPIHGIIHNQYNQNIIYNMNRQFNQNNRDVLNDAHIGEDGMIWVGNTNNYKFYESKNLKNKNEEVNSLTLHHLRGEEKYSNKKNINNASNVYVATKVVPVITDSNVSNFEEYHSGSGNNFTNDENETHDENCPIHGDKNNNEQE